MLSAFPNFKDGGSVEEDRRGVAALKTKGWEGFVGD